MTKERVKVKCPECGKEYAHQGALNLHLSRSGCGKEKEDIEGCPVCGGITRALSAIVPEEKLALQEGFEEVCIKCLELI